MKTWILFFRLLLLTAFVAAGPSVRAQPVADLLPIFNGRDLAGWRVPDPNPFWRVEAGVLVGENDERKTGNMLWTEKSYGNFILELEVRWQGEIDTGVMLRQPELQMQLGISRSLKRDMSGSFYVGGKVGYPEAGQAKEAEKHLRPGEWNKFRLEARGADFTVWINGHPVARFNDAKYAGAAPIGLQIHAGVKMRVEFRNVRALALP